MPKGRNKRPARTEFREPWGWSGGQNVMLQASDSDSESTTSTAKSSNSASHVSELAGLSVEVVEHILSFLSGDDIVVCKRVSRWFRDIIDGSVLLQYIVECFLAGVVDNPARRESMQERLEAVQRWRAATRHPRWATGASSSISIQASHSICIFGAIYIIQEEEQLIITQPPSEVKGRAEQQWSIDTSKLGFEIDQLAYDHSQGVLAFVEFAQDSLYRVHMLSVDGSPHPLASTPVESACFEYNSLLPIAVDVKIFGSKALLAVREAYNFREQTPYVWDWHTGKSCTIQIKDILSSCWGIDFLTPHHILAGTLLEDGRNFPDGVVVYINEDVLGSEQYAVDHTPGDTAVIFALPEPAPGAIYREIDVSCHHPSSEGNGDIFYQPADRAVVHIWAFMEIDDELSAPQLSFSIFVPVDVILALVQEAIEARGTTSAPQAAPIVVPWSKWGYRTRIMDVDQPWRGRRQSGPSASTSLCPDFSTTYYYDFNTTPAIKADWCSPHFTPRSSLVVKPSKTERPDYWAHPRVWTSLPYRKHALEIKGAGNARVGEDFILTIDAEFGDESVRVTVYTI